MKFIYCAACMNPGDESLDFCENCGSVFIELMEKDLLPPYISVRDRYKITALLKTGGMARVYRAHDTSLNTSCVLKELILDNFKGEDRKYIISRFKSEAEILANLRHYHLPHVIDYFSERGKYYLVMDYIKGKDLQAVLDETHPSGLEVEKVLEWTLQICDVLEYLHKQTPPVVFRDLKPSNIMVRDDDGKIMLVDFGLAARVMEKGYTDVQESIGTAGYAPPEQYRGTCDIRSDLYSLGATIHHLVTGVAPMVPFKFQSLKKLKPDLPSKLNTVIMKLVEKDIERRYQTVEELRKDLTAVDEKIKSSQKSLVTKIKDGTDRIRKKFTDSIGLSREKGEENAEKIRVFLVDDEDQPRSLFKNLIALNEDMELAGVAISGINAITKLKETEPFPHVILMDIMMPEMDGIDATRKILEFKPDARIIMLTVLGDRSSVIDAFRAGAKGYLIKYKVDEVMNGIRDAAKGETPIESSVAGFLLQELGKNI